MMEIAVEVKAQKYAVQYRTSSQKLLVSWCPMGSDSL
jgi:hypothetical protein